MGKAPPKHLKARLDHLFNAAKYLREVHESTSRTKTMAMERRDLQSRAETHVGSPTIDLEVTKSGTEANSRSLSIETVAADHVLVAQIRSIATKAQIRLSREAKHQLCKGCDAVLIPNVTSTTKLENKSKRGRKPHATTKIVHCNLCGVKKHFPIGAKRQLRKSLPVRHPSPLLDFRGCGNIYTPDPSDAAGRSKHT